MAPKRVLAGGEAMGVVVSKFAFMPPPPSYDCDDASLSWVETSRGNRLPVKVFEYPVSMA